MHRLQWIVLLCAYFLRGTVHLLTRHAEMRARTTTGNAQVLRALNALLRHRCSWRGERKRKDRTVRTHPVPLFVRWRLGLDEKTAEDVDE